MAGLWQLQVIYHSPLAMLTGTLNPGRLVVGCAQGMRYVIRGTSITEQWPAWQRQSLRRCNQWGRSHRCHRAGGKQKVCGVTGREALKLKTNDTDPFDSQLVGVLMNTLRS